MCKEYQVKLTDNSVLAITAGTDEEAEFTARYLAGEKVLEISCQSSLFAADEPAAEDLTTLF